MYFKFIALTLALVVLGRAASVSPHKDSTAEAVSVKDVSRLTASTPVHSSPTVAFSEKTPSVKGLSAMSPNSAFHALNAEISRGIYLCTGQGCTGLCYTYTFGLSADTCYQAEVSFTSGAVGSGGYFVPYEVFVGLSQCQDPVRIPMADTCYNFYYDGQAVPFSTFYFE